MCARGNGHATPARPARPLLHVRLSSCAQLRASVAFSARGGTTVEVVLPATDGLVSGDLVWVTSEADAAGICRVDVMGVKPSQGEM